MRQIVKNGMDCMIKLTISSSLESTPLMTRYFKQASIIIGGDQAQHADLKLTGHSLQDRHLQIVKQIENGKTSFFVTNLVNDPFVTLNNLPFGKQPLYANDLIQVGDISIRFEWELDSQSDSSPKDALPQDSYAAHSKQEESRDIPSLETLDPLNLKKRRSPLPANLIETSPKNLSNDLAYPFTQNNFLNTEKKVAGLTPQPPSSPKLSLKDYYLSEYDDQDDPSISVLKKNTPTLSPQFTKSWRTFLTLATGFLGFFAIVISLVYLWVSDQTGEDEIKASKTVADVSMSLTYAQLKHIHPQNQNWSNPEFIRNNLNPILAPNYIPLADVDAHGQFANCPYMLRIYTSSDLSQFLVIAQPAPSLLQWLVPKASIVIDSRVMEMRKIKDLKALNRLIVNANNLDGTNATEISNLVKQGELIPLSNLVNKAENQGLIPPKALALIRPGAENLVYNAPRYYLLGETILDSAVDLVDKLATVKEVNILQQELSYLREFPDFVLYSSDGIQHALESQKALSTLLPKENFLIAYLQLNAHGKIANTHLLMDDNQSDIAIGEKTLFPFSETESESNQMTDDHSEYHLTHSDASGSQDESTPNNPIDNNDPLLLQLAAIGSLRQLVLKPIADDMVDLLKKHTLSAQPDFSSRFEKLQQKYAEVDEEQKDKIFKKFKAIIHENVYLPAAKFIEYLKASDLRIAFQEYLLRLRQQFSENQISNEQIEQHFQHIQESTTWQELENQVLQINKLLQFDHLSDDIQLIVLQNTTRILVTQKLNQFILSSNEALPSKAFAPENLQTLINILKAVWISDPDTQDFYVAEFELREP